MDGGEWFRMRLRTVLTMDVSLARWLVSADAEPVLAAASLRKLCEPDQAAAALTQAALRARARAKFGDRAETLFLTSDGLQQATRAPVARWRAERFAAAGVRSVLDVGCGLGSDALAFADAGLTVTGIEADPVTAVFAQANLGDRGRVVCGRAEDLADSLLESGDNGTGIAPDENQAGETEGLLGRDGSSGVGVFVDPARRDARGRSWRIEDLSPSWEFATRLLHGRFGCLKAGPGLDQSHLFGQEALWVSESGDLVELSLWTDGTGVPGTTRAAVLLPSGDRMDVDPSPSKTGPVGAVLYEPDPAVIRSGGTDTLAARLGAHRLAAGIAYLSADEAVETPFATAFEVLDILPHDEKALRTWTRANAVGALEIKTRGLGVDPAVLRRRLRPSGRASATLVLTPTTLGARALVVRRLRKNQDHPWHSV